jgi:hypothetical protein
MIATDKRPKPIGVCTKCGRVTYRSQRLNEPCSNRNDDDDKLCSGHYRSAFYVADWEQCSACEATGQMAHAVCGSCGGVGWRYVRQR